MQLLLCRDGIEFLSLRTVCIEIFRNSSAAFRARSWLDPFVVFGDFFPSPRQTVELRSIRIFQADHIQHLRLRLVPLNGSGLSVRENAFA